MPKERTIPEIFLGTWGIREVGEHSRQEIDLAGPAQITFKKDGGGSIRFVGAEGDLDCRYVDKFGRDFVEFTWAGKRASKPVSGRGWAHVLKTGGMMGHLFVHIE